MSKTVATDIQTRRFLHSVSGWWHSVHFSSPTGYVLSFTHFFCKQNSGFSLSNGAKEKYIYIYLLIIVRPSPFLRLPSVTIYSAVPCFLSIVRPAPFTLLLSYPPTTFLGHLISSVLLVCLNHINCCFRTSSVMPFSISTISLVVSIRILPNLALLQLS